MYQGFKVWPIIIILLLLSTTFSYSQSAFIPLNDDYYHLIDRLEIKRGKLTQGFHFNVKPFERKAVVALTDSIIQEGNSKFTRRDWETIDYIREDSWEWTNGSASVFYNLGRLGWRKPLPPGKTRKFWEHAADFYGKHNKDWDLHFNFVTTEWVGKDNNSDSAQSLWFTSRGVEIRGMINNKLGFYTYVTDNQGRFPQYVQEFSPPYSFPGEGLAKKTSKNGTDFLSARGYITFRPLKAINVKFGHDYNTFGSGYRSMILSDNSAPYLFLRIDTQLGKFHYTNLWTSMLTDDEKTWNAGLRGKKFAAIHHLSLNLGQKFNVGIFEAEVFSRDSVGGGYDLNYLNPIIFYRYVESYLGSQDNALLGMDFRWLLGKSASVYGQFVLDEFLTKNMFNGSKSWTNKYSLQIGSKYVDAFGIPNLDLQGEFNLARPYIYSHKDSGRNYAHYGQALAHPLGGNLKELVGIMRYKATSRLSIYGTIMLANQGKDSVNVAKSYGGNILKSYELRYSDNGNKIGQGISTKTSSFDLRLSYSLAHNLFLDGRLLVRTAKSPEPLYANKTNVFSFGVRYNMSYRQQTY